MAYVKPDGTRNKHQKVLVFINILEEFRDLTLLEWNFRALLEKKLIHFLELQRIYWKQRGTIKWVKDGDAGIKFFHANATLRHRKNLISMLEDSSGNQQVAHTDKEKILWDSFKDRLGVFEFDSMMLDLQSLLLHQPS